MLQIKNYSPPYEWFDIPFRAEGQIFYCTIKKKILCNAAIKKYFFRVGLPGIPGLGGMDGDNGRDGRKGQGGDLGPRGFTQGSQTGDKGDAGLSGPVSTVGSATLCNKARLV